jgi:four helix bundle protein
MVAMGYGPLAAPVPENDSVLVEKLADSIKRDCIFLATEARNKAYGLTSRLRRSAASIPANLAEACGRRGDTEFSRFVRISLGCATELESHLLLSRDIGLLETATHDSLSAQVVRIQGMLAGLNRALKRRKSIPSWPIAHSP